MKYSCGYVVVLNEKLQPQRYNFRWDLKFSNQSKENQNFEEQIHPDDLDKVRQAFSDVQNQSQSSEIVFRLRCREGRFCYLSSYISYDQDMKSFVLTADDVTRLKRFEQTHRGLEKFSKIGSWEIDLQTKELLWSEMTYRIHEVDIDSYKPKLEDGLSFFHPESVPVLTEAVSNLIQYGVPYDLELKFITARGRHRLVRVAGYAEFKDGNPVHVFGTFQDVTEVNRKLDQELQEKRKLDLTISVGGIGTWEFFPQTESIFFSVQWCKILGYEIYEVANDVQTLWNLVHFEDLKVLQTAIIHCASRKTESFEVTQRIRHKDGHWLTIYTKGRAVDHDQDGNPVKILAVAVDQTQLMSTQHKLEKAKAEVEKFFTVAVEMLCVITTDGRFLRINPVFCQVLGYSEEEVLEMSFLKLIHSEDIGDTLNEIKKLRAGIPTVRFENRYRCKSGEYRVFSWSASPDLESGLIYCSVRDLTDYKQAQMMLIQSAKLASLGEMAAGIAHEINNPLAIIHAKAEYLLQKLKSKDLSSENASKYSQDVNKIIDTSERIAKIVKGLRAFSRDSSADVKKIESLEKILNSSVELFRERFKNNDVKLTVEVATELFIKCRNLQIEQVILNLVNNAYDAIQDLEDKWIEIKAQAGEKCIMITVTDSGKGIPLAVANKIMNPFFTTKEIGKGTGLGLSISRGIIQDHQGRLYYNEKHPNTQFLIELPLVNQSSKSAVGGSAA